MKVGEENIKQIRPIELKELIGKMEQKIYVIMLLTLIIVISCNKAEDEIRLSNLSTPIITGYEMRDETGDVIKNVGNPNVKLGDKSNNKDSSKYYFLCYPNPTSAIFNISFKMPKDSVLKRVWITAATDYGGPSNSGIDPNLAKIGGASIIEFELFLDQANIIMEDFNKNDSLQTNGNPFSDGFYRIYVQVDSVLLWDNIYLRKH